MSNNLQRLIVLSSSQGQGYGNRKITLFEDGVIQMVNPDGISKRFTI